VRQLVQCAAAGQAPQKNWFRIKNKKKKCTMYIKLGLLWAARRDACVRKIIHLYVYQRVYPLKLFNKSKSKRNKNQEKKKNELKSEQQIPWDRKKIARTATIKA